MPLENDNNCIFNSIRDRWLIIWKERHSPYDC